VGDYRAIYTVDHAEDRVVVLFVGHRKDVNDDFDKIF
jgi:mRNA-degrading endonuclease RelE of RelBE toxin-antitoxin system